MLPEAETDYVRTRVVRSEKRESVERKGVEYAQELTYFCVGAALSGAIGLIVCIANGFNLSMTVGPSEEIVQMGDRFVFTRATYDLTTFVVMLVCAAFVITLLLAGHAFSEVRKMPKVNQYSIGSSTVISLAGLITLVVYA